jgi:hypothetical protein
VDVPASKLSTMISWRSMGINRFARPRKKFGVLKKLRSRIKENEFSRKPRVI